MSFFSHKEEEQYKQDFISVMMKELYNQEREGAFSVELITSKQQGVVTLKKSRAEKEALLPRGQNKLDKKAMEAYKILKGEINGLDFLINKTENDLEKLYTDVVEHANNARAIEKNIDFVRTLDLNKIPQLPYIVVRGTKYQCESNRPVLDKNGTMMLYIEKANAKSDTQDEKTS